MRNIKYFLFSLLCLFNFSVVFAEGEVIVKNVTPVYDAESTIVVTENENSSSVVFNDKDQSVLYKVVLENTTNKDLPVDGIELSRPSEDFLSYKLDGLNSDDVIKANSTKELTISLETIKKEGWGRNFNDELVASISFDTSVLNPNTSDNIVIISLITIGAVAGFVFLKKYKVARYGVIVIAFFSFAPCIKADFKFVLPVTIDASYVSQNVMIPSTCEEDEGFWDCTSFWEHHLRITNIYIQNEITEFEEYAYVYDVSLNEDGKVLAYLIENDYEGYFSTYYDLYLQADGIIYPNEDMSYYFAGFNLDVLDNLEGIDTSNVIDMNNLFNSTIFNQDNYILDLNVFDTSNVTNMSEMFCFTKSSKSGFTIDISDFDTSKVTDMSGMFFYVNTYGVLNINFGNFNTGSVTDMSDMFSLTGLSSEFINFIIKKWDTSSVIDMWDMFYHYHYGEKKSKVNLNLSGFDLHKAVDLDSKLYFIGEISDNLNLTFTIDNQIDDVDFIYSQLGSFVSDGDIKITLNYNSENELFVEQMIATKPETLNLVKGCNIDNIITFTIDGTVYEACEGMTWEQWGYSVFNTSYYTARDEYVNHFNYEHTVIFDDNKYVSDQDYIISGYSYHLALLPK